MSNELTRVETGAVGHALKVNDILAQVRLIQEVMQSVMHDGEHFGKIPGCGDKPTLLQPGAQKLLMTFRLAPEYEVLQTDMGSGHREYRVQCTLKSIQSGNFVGQGVGSCSTMEGKFRYRVAPKKLTDRQVPKSYWEVRGKDPKAAQQLLGGPGFSAKKDDNGQWMIAEGTSEKIEHDNPADYYNTVLKMAKKRALVDATITATAASDIFTQDIEDMPEVLPETEPKRSTPPPATASKPATQTQPAATTVDVVPQAPTEQTRAWFVKQVDEAQLREEVTGFLIDKAKLMPNESLDEVELRHVPASRQAYAALIKDVEEWSLGKDGLAPEPQGEAWRTFPMPYGKNSGVPLGELEKKYLYGLWANMTVETEYNGKPKKPETIEKDKLFRSMLDDAGRHYEFTKQD